MIYNITLERPSFWVSLEKTFHELNAYSLLTTFTYIRVEVSVFVLGWTVAIIVVHSKFLADLFYCMVQMRDSKVSEANTEIEKTLVSNSGKLHNSRSPSIHTHTCYLFECYDNKICSTHQITGSFILQLYILSTADSTLKAKKCCLLAFPEIEKYCYMFI